MGEVKKILHIQLLCKMSGVQKISYEILNNLDVKYDKYILFSNDDCVGDRQNVINLFNKADVKIIFIDNLTRELNIKKDWLAFLSIYKLCKKEKFDIVHTNSSKTGVIGRIAAKCAGTPLVIHTIHGLSFTKNTPKLKWILYYLCELVASFFCDKIVCVNEYYKKYFWYCKKKFITIYNAIDYNSLKKNEKIKRQDSNIRLLFVGRLDLQKNPLLLLKAFNVAVKQNPNLSLTIVGDGELLLDCKNYVKINCLDEKISFEGWKSNTSKYYNNSDIFISTSSYEAFGLTFLEAAFFELPIIATKVEGVPEVVYDNYSGFLSEADDVNALANNIIKLSNDELLRHRMGNFGYKYSLAKFNIEKMVNEYSKLYLSSDIV